MGGELAEKLGSDSIRPGWKRTWQQHADRLGPQGLAEILPNEPWPDPAKPARNPQASPCLLGAI
jgi:hypothetical protein